MIKAWGTWSTSAEKNAAEIGMQEVAMFPTEH